MSKTRTQQTSPDAAAERRARPESGEPGEAAVATLSTGAVSERTLAPEAGRVAVEDVPPVPTRPTDPGKRTVDVLFSLIGLVLTAPAWILIPLAIKLEDGGEVFYRDRRLGKGGEEFDALKFRSMVAGNGIPNVKAHPPAEFVTTVGSLIRPTALDELPQLVNILRGEMSLVGPRAAPPEEEAHDFEGHSRPLRDVAGFAERHAVRPGLTGLAQTRAARDVSYRTKFRYDRFYVENRTLWLDLKLIFKSVAISLLARWPEVERGKR